MLSGNCLALWQIHSLFTHILLFTDGTVYTFGDIETNLCFLASGHALS